MGLNNCLLMLLTLIYKDLLFVCFQFSIVILCSLEQHCGNSLRLSLRYLWGMFVVCFW